MCASLWTGRNEKKSGQDDDWLPRDMKTFFLLNFVCHCLIGLWKEKWNKADTKSEFLSLYVM